MDSFRSQAVKPAAYSIRFIPGPGGSVLAVGGVAEVITDTTLIWIVLLVAVGGFIVSCLWRAGAGRDPRS